jgi:predicted short-subunit dehydrogenase-like oxidoreductase (DUF2520 family)
MSNVVIIGAGNVGYHLATQLSKKKYTILQVYSRTLERAADIAALCHAQAIDNVKNINTDGDIYLMAIKDDRVEKLALKLKLGQKVVAHTSGSLPTAILSNVSENHGVFYPFQTFSRERKLDLSEVPICIDGNNDFVKEKLVEVAKSLSKNVMSVDEHKRLALHISGVFANNFPNHLFCIAEQILKNEGLSFDLLKPLIAETANKAIDLGPKAAQTGPAKRGDEKIINLHMEFLRHQQNLQQLYELLSHSIEKENK